MTGWVTGRLDDEPAELTVLIDARRRFRDPRSHWLARDLPSAVRLMTRLRHEPMHHLYLAHHLRRNRHGGPCTSESIVTMLVDAADVGDPWWINEIHVTAGPPHRRVMHDRLADAGYRMVWEFRLHELLVVSGAREPSGAGP